MALISILCICLLLAPVLPAQTPAYYPRAQVHALMPGTPVKVRLMNKQEIRGRLAEIRADDFTLQVAQGQRVETRTLAYSEVQWVRKAGGPKRFRVLGWGLAGAATAAVLLAAVSLR